MECNPQLKQSVVQLLTDSSHRERSNSVHQALQPTSKVQKDALQHLKDDYQIGKTVGVGGFCKVKLAIHIPTGEQVAIKIFDKKALIEEDGEDSLNKLLDENRILGTLHNEHIVRLYEVIDTPDIMYIVMEYASGGELFDYIIAHGHLEEYEACKFLHQIIHAVEYVHRHNIVHRDLKPENLLLDQNRDIKLIDFGLADRYDGFTSGQRLEALEHGGSPSYLAPEAIIDDPSVEIGFGVDIWAVGVILYALVAGALPFSGEATTDEDGNPEEDLNSLFQCIVSGEYTVPDFVSQDGKDLIAGMLYTDPAERFTIEQIQSSPWYQLYNDGSNEQGSSERVEEAINDIIVNELVNNPSFDRNFLIESLNAGRNNSCTAAYHLLSKKRKRTAGFVTTPPHMLQQEAAVDLSENSEVVTPDVAAGSAAQYAQRQRASRVQHRHGSVSHAHVDNPEAALEDIERTLGQMGIKWKKKGSLFIKCVEESRDIVFELKIERLHHEQGDGYKLRLNRLKGEIWEFKDLGRQLLEKCQNTLNLHHIR